MTEVIIPTTDDNGKRLDVVLSRHLPGKSRSYWQRACKEGRVKVNGQVCNKDSLVRIGQKISVFEPETVKKAVDVPALYEDENVIVIDKPAGILTHAKGAETDEFTVADFIAPKTSDTSNRAGIVHRLDRSTSGVMICAKSAETRLFLQKQFATRSVNKVYLAVVEGKIDQNEVVFKWPLQRHPKQPKQFRVDPNGKSAETRIAVSKRSAKRSVINAFPKTGRTHQIRVHLSHYGHPVLGDTLYGSTTDLKGRIMLHAYSLKIRLNTGKQHKFVAPIPNDMKEYMA